MFEKFIDRFTTRQLYNEIKEGKIDKTRAFSKPGLFKKGVGLAKEIMSSIKATDLPGVSAQMAFIMLLAFLPTLLFILLICSSFVPNFDQLFLGIITQMLPKLSSEYILSQINTFLNYLSSASFIIVGASALLGTLGAHTILVGLNETYGLEGYSSKKWEWTKSFLLLMALVVLLSVLTLISLRAGIIASKVLTGVASDDTRVADFFISLGAFSSIFLILLGVYTYTPEKRIKFIDALPGTIFAILGIFIVFEIYVQILNRSMNYLIVYGSLSGLFVLLTALYFLSMIINVGAKVNVIFAKKRDNKNVLK